MPRTNGCCSSAPEACEPGPGRHRMSQGLQVRPATPDDIPAIQAIYAHHVRFGLGSFEAHPPPIEEMQARFEAVHRLSLPYLVAAAGGEILGFSNARPYRERAAYRHTVEDAVYVAPDRQRRGVGRSLLAAVVGECARLPVHCIVALIGDSGNQASIGLHRAQGFATVGVLREVGHKFDRWVDVVLMQRLLTDNWA